MGAGEISAAILKGVKEKGVKKRGVKRKGVKRKGVKEKGVKERRSVLGWRVLMKSRKHFDDQRGSVLQRTQITLLCHVHHAGDSQLRPQFVR